MLELGIVGAKNSGKTTLVEKLVTSLSKAGYDIATIKHTSHSHTFDTPGKDSYRHRKAGAQATIAVSKKDFACFSSPDSELSKELTALMHKHCDVCLVEGDVLSQRPKIVLSRIFDRLKEQNPKNIVAVYGPPCRLDSIIRFELNDLDGVCNFIIDLISKQKNEVCHEG